MSRLTRWIDQRFYAQYEQNWDNQLFRRRILERIRPEHVVLDLGAGAGFVKAMDFKGRVRRICGVDLDPRVVDNPMLDEGRLADAGTIPYNDASFDVVFSDNVLEHLAEPEKVFAEVKRVLKPGGLFLFKTPNKHHYMPLIARLTPHGFHVLVNRWRGREAEEVFPTLYRANSRGAILNLAQATGMKVVTIERIEARPEYLRFAGLPYLVGLAYERLVNSSRLFEPLRILLIGVLQKPPS